MKENKKILEPCDVLRVGDTIYAFNGVEHNQFALDLHCRWFSLGDTLASAKMRYDELPGPWKMTGAVRVTKRVSRKEYKRRFDKAIESIAVIIAPGRPWIDRNELAHIANILRGEE